MEFLDVTWFPLPHTLTDLSPALSSSNRQIHLVGSSPLSGPEHVFRTFIERFPNQLKRIPDGHPGYRRDTFQWQMSMLRAAGLDHLTRLDQDSGHISFSNWAIALPTLETGFDQHAITSYSTFARLKLSGVIPSHVRFQISLPLPHCFTSCCILPAYQQMFEPCYEQAIKRALDHIQARIPHLDLAIQFDCHSRLSDISIESALRLIDAVSPDIDLGLHIHPPQDGGSDRDTEGPVDWIRRLAQQARRRITYVHFPVLEATTTESMQAMRSLSLVSECEVHLGLIHGDRDAVKRRVGAAIRVFGERGFGISTPCGLGDLPVGDFQNTLQELKDYSQP